MAVRFKILLRTICLTMTIAMATIASAQHVRPSTTVLDKDKYAGPTKWSCIDKHYGYYFLSYAMPIPIEKNNIEKEGLSGKFRVGYMYRYKIAKPFDIGVQLNYLRQSTGIDPTLFGTMSKISVIEHSIECGAFMRFNFGKSDFRHLGWHIDLGADYSYDFAFLNKYISFYDNPSRHSKIKRKDRIKKEKTVSRMQNTATTTESLCASDGITSHLPANTTSAIGMHTVTDVLLLCWDCK